MWQLVSPSKPFMNQGFRLALMCSILSCYLSNYAAFHISSAGVRWREDEVSANRIRLLRRSRSVEAGQNSITLRIAAREGRPNPLDFNGGDSALNWERCRQATPEFPSPEATPSKGSMPDGHRRHFRVGRGKLDESSRSSPQSSPPCSMERHASRPSFLIERPAILIPPLR
jgi:hypothetical protein